MIRYQYRNIFVFVKAVSKPSKRVVGIEQIVRSNAPHRKNHFGLQCIDLRVKKSPARCAFIGFGVAVFGRTAFYDVCNKAVCSPVKFDSVEHFIKELPRASYKRQALPVFFSSRSLADYQHVWILRSHARNNVFSRCGKFTGSAGMYFLRDYVD